MKTKTYQLSETKITAAGVLRCCLYDVATEYEGREIKLGDTSKCPHCDEDFTLVDSDKGYPTWTPNWQLKKK